MPTPDNPELRDIQGWLHTFVTAHGDTSQALLAAEKKVGFAPGSAEDLILPSPTLEPQERIQIYRNMYLLRMGEALEVDFPMLVTHLGQEDFENLVASYVESYPSQSYTLDHLGRNFAQYLRDVDCKGEGDFLSELAAFEWSLCEVSIALDSNTISMADLSTLNPERFVEICLNPVPALQRWQFQFNVNDVYKAWLDEDARFAPISIPEKDPVNLVIWRHDLTVWRQELSDSAFFFLGALCRCQMLGAALDSTIDQYQATEEQLFSWFQEWLEEGFFSSYTLSG